MHSKNIRLLGSVIDDMETGQTYFSVDSNELSYIKVKFVYHQSVRLVTPGDNFRRGLFYFVGSKLYKISQTRQQEQQKEQLQQQQRQQQQQQQR